MNCTENSVFFTLVVCFFGMAMTKFLTPSEQYHKGGFGGEDYDLPNTTDNMKYRILYRSGSVFYVGGKGSFYRINVDSAEEDCELAYPDMEIQRCDVPAPAIPCESSAPIDAKVDCHNYIRIVQEYTDTDGKTKLLVCGTNALNPRCYTYILNTDTCPGKYKIDHSMGGIDGSECSDTTSYDAMDIAPRNWNLNYTYLYSLPDASTSADTIFFTGVSKSTEETDPIWANYLVTPEKLGTPDTPFDFRQDTYPSEARAVNEANFVGKPYKYTKDGSTFVLFFYRETAVEFINHGKIIYSRVGRVCRDDAGNSLKWSSFLKARLNCSLPNEYPADFNELQDMSVIVEADETYFYGVFATPSNGVSTSALCRYRLTDIHDVFQNSKFKRPENANSLWLPVNPDVVPTPRPGSDCSNPSSDTTFIQNTPLMNSLVENYNPNEPTEKSDAPLFFTDSGGRFSTIAVDMQTNDIEDNIYYIGTESGNVLKAYQVDSEWKLFRYWQKGDEENNEAITGLEFIAESGGNGPWLFATTDNSLTKIDLKYGKAQNKDQHDEVYYPYLIGETPFLGTGVINSDSNTTHITTCDNRQVNLFCEGTLDETSGVGNITWYMGDGETEESVQETKLGHLLSQTHLTGELSFHPASFLTILVLEGKTAKNYSCEVLYDIESPIQRERAYFDIKVKTCITEQSVNNREAEYYLISEKAYNRTQKYDAEGICVIEHPILCSQSCPYN